MVKDVVVVVRVGGVDRGGGDANRMRSSLWIHGQWRANWAGVLDENRPR